MSSGLLPPPSSPVEGVYWYRRRTSNLALAGHPPPPPSQAEAQNIPYQFESVSGYGEDASVLQRAGRGVPVINLGITTRYGHSQSGVIDIADYHRTVALILSLVRGLDQATVADITRF